MTSALKPDERRSGGRLTDEELDAFLGRVGFARTWIGSSTARRLRDDGRVERVPQPMTRKTKHVWFKRAPAPPTEGEGT